MASSVEDSAAVMLREAQKVLDDAGLVLSADFACVSDVPDLVALINKAYIVEKYVIVCMITKFLLDVQFL